MDKAFWEASRMLSQQAASQRLAPNAVLFEDRYDTAIMRDYISRRYLTEAERVVYDGLSPRRRRQWLAGRVAAKDAVLDWVRRERGVGAVFPQELRIENDDIGAPRIRANVTGTVPETLHLSISHKDALAAAIVGEQPVGIDIERIEAHEEGVLSLMFSEAERALLLTDEDAAAGAARGWVAKEVAAKAAGTGLGGRPRDFVIDARDSDRLCVNGLWVETRRLRDCIIGWSLPASAAIHAGLVISNGLERFGGTVSNHASNSYDDVLAAVIAQIRTTINEDWIQDFHIDAETRFDGDLELESIEFVKIADAIQAHFGTQADVAGWLSGKSIQELIGLSVGDLAGFIAGAQAQAA
jgi:phosphopantetheinyl transferase (holo-ACP synthase)/acyl carrier protein